ncbi:unnamed protein product [Ceratitis capitata]|uniref:(Mediterranean fruit fly) hypothetical protein n=1 Tax=Ceratitis capitata TaxID=7213 RepID=A0A811UTY2_CERCA|nr:unnamed protein product [Ceratitis capitata]
MNERLREKDRQPHCLSTNDQHTTADGSTTSRHSSNTNVPSARCHRSNSCIRLTKENNYGASVCDEGLTIRASVSWSDDMLLFAAQRKFKGVAKDWINAQRVSVMGKFYKASINFYTINSLKDLAMARTLLTMNHATSARTDQHASSSKVKCYNCNKHGHITAKCLHQQKKQRCRQNFLK